MVCLPLIQPCRWLLHGILLVIIAVASIRSAAQPVDSGSLDNLDRRNCLIQGYPNYLKGPWEDWGIASHRGHVYPFASNMAYRDDEDERVRASLASQVRQSYPLGRLLHSPARGNDPGRLRHTPLFADMYGDTAAAVEKNLRSVRWLPCNCDVLFSQVNGASVALERVGQAIVRAGLTRYVAQPLGTFNWRFIAGTKRLSPHAFGIAIDFALPDGLGRYWRWDLKGTPFPDSILRDPGLNHVVAIFEQHGFIWGGKWGHYDSVHFEYRPELTMTPCGQPN